MMTIEIGLLFLLILAMIVIMAFEWFSPDTLALTIMVVLILGGFVTPSEGIAGLSNQATVTILALMILTVGLETTGVITRIGKWLKGYLVDGGAKSFLLILLIVGCCSALISTTAIVIVFMRILIKLSKKFPIQISLFLIPLSFAGIMGGSCTLLGTSTNLLVDAIAVENGIQKFGIFEFTHIGVILFFCGLVYLLFARKYLLPKQLKEEDLTEEYAIQDYLTEVVVGTQSGLTGKRVDETEIFIDEEIDLIEIRKPAAKSRFGNESEIIEEGDVLLLKGSAERLAAIRYNNNLDLLSKQTKKDEARMNTNDMTLCEVIVKPNSRLSGKSLNKINIKRDYDAIPLAVKKNRRYYQSGLDDLKIESGDTVLMEVGRSNFKQFYNSAEFVILQEHENLAAKSNKRKLAAAIMVSVILLASFNILPILTSALTGCVLMFLSGCLDLQKAYRRVEWNVFFLLAGVIPLGTAMENSGASQLIADTFVTWFRTVSPRMLIAVLYLFTTLLSAVISNNATAILFAPIAISIATNLDMDPRPLLLTVMFAANMSFMSPIGYQTNTLVYSVGQYRFTDFLKVGGLLSIIVWLLIIWLLPLFYL
jgi:di/tricarboxylate transporter